MQQLQKPKQGYNLVKSLFGKYEEIPEEWAIIKLTEIAEILGRIGWKGLTTVDYRNDGPLFFSVYNISKDFQLDLSDVKKISEERYLESPEIIIKEHDILLAKSGTIGRLCYIENFKERATINAAINIIRCNHKIFPKYLFYFLSWPKTQSQLVSISAAGAQPNLFQKDMKIFPIILPTTPEQQKITSILSNIDSLIQNTQKIIKQTQDLRKGLLQKLMTRGIGHTKFKKVDLGKPFLITEMPEEWRLEPFKKILTVQYNQVKLIDSQKYVRIIVKRRHEGIISRDEVYGKQILTDNQFRVNTGEFIISRRQIIHNACGIIPKQFDGAVVSNEYSLFTGTDQLDINYFDYFSQTDLFNKTIILTTHGVHIEKYIFLLNEWLNLKMPLPSINEQKKIVKSITLVEQKLEKNLQLEIYLQTLKKGLMQKLLTGKIRVKV